MPMVPLTCSIFLLDLVIPEAERNIFIAPRLLPVSVPHIRVLENGPTSPRTKTGCCFLLRFKRFRTLNIPRFRSKLKHVLDA